LDAVVETIQDALAKGDKVQIIGFGSFEVRDRKARKVISPAMAKRLPFPLPKFRHSSQANPSKKLWL
jgi:DNA-binding protein HU-beta